jgi:hypothetical protein
MKSLIALMILIGSASIARADGFVCQTLHGDLQIQVYNHVRAEEGTRNAAVMILSDPRVSVSNRTIAVFRDTHSNLYQEGATYTAKVDLRYNESGREGEYVLGTRLGNLDTLELSVGFTYGDGLLDGDVVPGTLDFTKRDGTDGFAEVDCVRYLKGE